jgi:hypothetical protein
MSRAFLLSLLCLLGSFPSFASTSVQVCEAELVELRPELGYKHRLKRVNGALDILSQVQGGFEHAVENASRVRASEDVRVRRGLMRERSRKSVNEDAVIQLASEAVGAQLEEYVQKARLAVFKHEAFDAINRLELDRATLMARMGLDPGLSRMLTEDRTLGIVNRYRDLARRLIEKAYTPDEQTKAQGYLNAELEDADRTAKATIAEAMAPFAIPEGGAEIYLFPAQRQPSAP